jgi:histidinol phosphatase-like enzyme (inositol monophosphatase family)
LPGACPQPFIELAERLADAAGRVSLEYFRRPLAVESKQDTSPVTVADRGAEATLREMVAKAFPEHGIVGEEFGAERADAEYDWVFDPIDGTKAFITGNPQFGNLIALMQDNRPILGVINIPAQGDRWVGALGHPTTFSDARGRHRCQVRPCASMAEGIFRTISPQLFKGREALHQAIQDRMKLALYGGDCFSYGQVASGWVDLVIEAGLGVYDYLALVPVIEGAGGVMSDWQGRPLGLQSDGRVVAAGDRRVQAEALALLAE